MDKITVKTMEHMNDLEARGIIKPTRWEKLAMMLIEQNRELDRVDRAVVQIMGAESKGEAAEFFETRPSWSYRVLRYLGSVHFWKGWLAGVLVVILLSLAIKSARAEVAFELDLFGPDDISTEFMLTGTMTNTGTDTLGVIGGLRGEPAGYDYEIGAQSFVSSGYGFSWAPDFPSQFDDVNLLPGESFAFDFALLNPVNVNDIDTYRSWLEIQVYPAPRPSDVLAKARAEITWTTAGFIGTTQPDANNPPPDISGGQIEAEAGEVTVEAGGGGAMLWLLLPLLLVGCVPAPDGPSGRALARECEPTDLWVNDRGQARRVYRCDNG